MLRLKKEKMKTTEGMELTNQERIWIQREEDNDGKLEIRENTETTELLRTVKILRSVLNKQQKINDISV